MVGKNELGAVADRVDARASRRAIGRQLRVSMSIYAIRAASSAREKTTGFPAPSTT
jgi:hypothetical protein